jgi:hypothetical protein
MTSERKLAANRNNAKRSTGPRTARGKLQVRSNATQHALAANALQDPRLVLQVERLVKAVCGEGKSELQLEQARDIAESQLLLTRARAARFAAMQSLASIMRTRNEGIIHSGEMKPKLDLDPADPKGEGVAARQFETFRRALAEMMRYDRYERRASSRRQRAIRTLVATSILGTPPSKYRPRRGTDVNLKSHKP